MKDIWRHLDDAKRILREVKVLQLMGSHENLLWLSDLFVWPQPAAAGPSSFAELYIVTDLLETDLSRIIESSQPLTTSHVKYFTYQILRGLKYVHSMSILHRDVKPQNVLINANCELVLCDFGLSRVTDTMPDCGAGDDFHMAGGDVAASSGGSAAGFSSSGRSDGAASASKSKPGTSSSGESVHLTSCVGPGHRVCVGLAWSTQSEWRLELQHRIVYWAFTTPQHYCAGTS